MLIWLTIQIMNSLKRFALQVIRFIICSRRIVQLICVCVVVFLVAYILYWFTVQITKKSFIVRSVYEHIKWNRIGNILLICHVLSFVWLLCFMFVFLMFFLVLLCYWIDVRLSHLITYLVLTYLFDKNRHISHGELWRLMDFGDIWPWHLTLRVFLLALV